MRKVALKKTIAHYLKNHHHNHCHHHNHSFILVYRNRKDITLYSTDFMMKENQLMISVGSDTEESWFLYR